MMTRVEILAFNAGVEAVLAIARRTSEGLARTSRRRVHEEFAVVALAELADAARALLVPVPTGSPEADHASHPA